jgi:hypothetical protein
MTVGNLAALRQENVKRMLAYSSIAHAGYLLAAFAGLGLSGVAAASFYIAAYAAMNVGIFAVVTVVSGYDEKAAADRRLPRADLSRSDSGRTAALLPHLADRHSLHRRLLRQVLLVLNGSARRRGVARPDRPAQLRPGRRVLPETGRFRCAAAPPVPNRRFRMLRSV